MDESFQIREYLDLMAKVLQKEFVDTDDRSMIPPTIDWKTREVEYRRLNLYDVTDAEEIRVRTRLGIAAERWDTLDEEQRIAEMEIYLESKSSAPQIVPNGILPDGAEVNPDQVPSEYREEGQPNGAILCAAYLKRSEGTWRLQPSYLSRYYNRRKYLTRRIKVQKVQGDKSGQPGYAYLWTELVALRQHHLDTTDKFDD